MKIKEFLTKNWTHFAVIGFILIVSVVFFKPQLDGYNLKQHDLVQWKGMSNEADMYRLDTGEEALWTNSMFGGMPTTQISTLYKGNLVKTSIYRFYDLFPSPIGLLILHLLGFYIMALFLRINPLIGLLAGLAFSFASYEIIIIQAGHFTKSSATAFLAPLLGAFIYSYRTRKWSGVGFAALFMAFELAMNHVQVTYYFILLLLALGFYFLYDAIKEKTVPSFLKISGGLILGFGLAIIINSGNLLNTSGYVAQTIRGGNDVKTAPNGEVNKNESNGLDKAYITEWSYGLGETFTLLSPNVKGGGSFPIGGSQFNETLENADLTESSPEDIAPFGAYWGEQPFTSGPVYIGVIVMLLALLGMFFLESKIKWPLFIIVILAILLSWGKNFMGLTDFFIDHVPGYNKFRTVTIILILVELCIPVIGVLFLHQMIKEKERMKTKMKPIIYVLSGFFLFVLVLKFTGLGDTYISTAEREQLVGVEKNIREDLKKQDPAMLQSQYGIDVTNAAQVNAVVEKQMLQYETRFSDLKKVRKDIYHSSMNRTLVFLFLTSGVILLFLYTQMSGPLLTLSLIVLVMMDSLPVAYEYIGDQEDQTGEYKYWMDEGLLKYPFSPNPVDNEIMALEISENPDLRAKIAKGEAKGKELADEEEYDGTIYDNVVNSYRFSALNFATNYRVFDLGGGFGSSRVSYFHKSLGGYHAAKLRNINNLYEYHLSKMNQKVYDMMNVKYFIRPTESGEQLIPRVTAMGNAWFVKTIEEHDDPDAEIRALGTTYNIANVGEGKFLVNESPVKSSVIYGGEKLQYLVAKNDSIAVQLPADMRVGDTALFVMDAKGQVNLIPVSAFKADSLRSFRKMVSIVATNTFEPDTEAVMLRSEAKRLSTKSFSGEGNIRMVKYGPKRMEYRSESKEKQLAVFSEVYYKNGWKAYVDGKEVEIVKANYLLRAVEIPAGNHKVELVFDMPSLHRSNVFATIASLLVLLGTAFLVYWEYRNNKKKTAEA